MNIIIHSISAYMEKPVLLLLIVLIVVTALMVGLLVSEYFTEHRHLNIALPGLLDELKEASEKENTSGKGGETKKKKEDKNQSFETGSNLAEVIKNAGLFIRQRDRLLELISHPDYTDFMRESLAVRLLTEEQEFYDRRILLSDLIAKIAPMLGLLGTLIPLGPGIIALGQGDTATLSASLLTAFDTTVVGLICAGLATLVSSVRNLWYRNYMSIFETLMECILELEKKETKPLKEQVSDMMPAEDS